MKKYFGSDTVSRPFAGAVTALGNFDGVHLGHQYILRHAVEEAQNRNGVSVAYTFDPHPVKILVPEGAPQLIQTLWQKLSCIEEQGIDVCIVEKFTKKFAAQSPEQFFENVLVGRLGCKEIIVGYDFTFGYHRAGTVEKLSQLGHRHGVKVDVIEPKFIEETLLSSTEIRNLIRSGHVEDATLLMGRCFRLEGKVIPGKGIGNNLGARTANILPENELIPGNGIYLTSTYLNNSKQERFPSISSIGTNPTFDGKDISIETHIIDFERNLTGQTLAIDFHKKIRDQVAFKSAEDLTRQIRADIDKARRMHEEIRTKK